MGKSSGSDRNPRKHASRERKVETIAQLLDFMEKTDETKDFHQARSGSYYLSLGGFSFRISDHGKFPWSLGAKNYVIGENDFRSVQEAYEILKKKGFKDVTSEKKKFFKVNAKKITTKMMGGELVYVNPYGRAFATKESALSNWWYTLRRPIDDY